MCPWMQCPTVGNRVDISGLAGATTVHMRQKDGTPGNIMGVSAPLLVMGMTGGYEFLAAEIIYEKAQQCTCKTIAFVV
jgi:hypothetical protein